MDPQPARLSPRAHVAIASLFVLIGVAATWPLALDMQFLATGAGFGDILNKTWRFWHTAEALRAGQNPAYIDLLGYPLARVWPIYGASLTIPGLFAPATLLASPEFAYNLALILSFGLTGYSAFLLVRDVVGSTRGALLGGLIVMLFPNRVVHAYVGHIEFASLYLPLLAIWALRRGITRGRWGTGLAGGALVALAAMVHLTTTAYFLLPLLVTVIPFSLWQQRQAGDARRAATITLGAASFAAVLLLPAYVPLLGFFTQNEHIVDATGDAKYMVDVLNLLLPHPANPVLGGISARVGSTDKLFRFAGRTATLGVSVVGLALIGVVRRPRREMAFWLAVAAGATTLALGPMLMVNGAPVAVGGATIPLPYALLDRVPLLQFGRTAGRYMPLASVGLAVLAAHGLAALGEGLAGRGQRNALAAAAALLIATEYVIPYSSMHGGQRAAIPQPVEALAALPDATAVLTVPVGTARREAMYYQTAHGLPLAAGRIDRDIDPVPGLLPLARQALTPDINRLPAADRETINAMLAHYGFDTVVLLRDMPLPGALDETEQLLAEVFGAPVLADARAAIYRVDGNTTANGRIVTIVDRFGQMGARRRGEEGTVAGDGMLYIYGPACARAEVTLNLSPATRTLDVIVTADGARQVFPVTERTDVTFEMPLGDGITPVELSVYRRGTTTNRTAELHALSVVCADAP